MTRELELAYTPLSINRVGSQGTWRTWHTAKSRLQRDLELLLMASGLPRRLDGQVKATAVLRFELRRRRDEGNYRALLEKALGDALVNGGWLPDDTPDLYTFGALTFDPDVGSARTLVTVST